MSRWRSLQLKLRALLTLGNNVYIASGLLLIAIFIIGTVVLTRFTGIELWSTAFYGFIGGFSLFVIMYFVSLTLYTILFD